jgi:transcriptional regulator with XRE-family HTH domain
MAEPTPSHFGQEVKRLRLEMGLSQESLAAVIRLTQGAVGHLETGRVKHVTADVMFRLCDALGVACDHFRPFLSELADGVANAEPEPARPVGKRK